MPYLRKYKSATKKFFEVKIEIEDEDKSNFSPNFMLSEDCSSIFRIFANTLKEGTLLFRNPFTLI